MQREGPLRLIRVCEDRAQADAVAVLAERTMAEVSPWFRDMRDDGQGHAAVAWTRRDRSPGWESLNQVAADTRPPSGLRGRFGDIHGHFPGAQRGQPGLPDATLFRKVFAAVQRSRTQSEDAKCDTWLIVGRDTDGQRDIQAAWDQAQAAWTRASDGAQGHSAPFTALLAVFHPEAEAWYLVGFTPIDDRERDQLEVLRRELGFDPTLKPDRCSAGRGGPYGSKRDAKDVLRRLAPTPERVADCLQAPLERLEERGAKAGVAAWIATARERLAAAL